MLVAELHQVLMDHELTCHRTCFSLQLGGATLDKLAELRSVQGIQQGAQIKVVEGNCFLLPSVSGMIRRVVGTETDFKELQKYSFLFELTSKLFKL